MNYRDSIGFVGGGNMAEALLGGIIRSGIVPPEKILVSEPALQRRSLLKLHYGIIVTEDNTTVAREAGTVFFAVKPQDLPGVLEEVGDIISNRQLAVSIAAGITLQFLEKFLDPAPVIRAMPNTPAQLEAGATVISPGKGVDEAMLAWTAGIFKSVGICLVLPEEHMDAVTGLSGSGPAYLFTVARAMADGGVRAGLSEKEAALLASQTVFGAARMLLETGKSPGELIDMVASPKGTTAAGLQILDEGGFSETLAKAVEAAAVRSRELGGK